MWRSGARAGQTHLLTVVYEPDQVAGGDTVRLSPTGRAVESGTPPLHRARRGRGSQGDRLDGAGLRHPARPVKAAGTVQGDLIHRFREHDPQRPPLAIKGEGAIAVRGDARLPGDLRSSKMGIGLLAHVSRYSP